MSSSIIPERPAPADAPQPVPLGHELVSARERLQQQRARARQGIWIETVGIVALMLIAVETRAAVPPSAAVTRL